jgi:hypothetical protein
MGGGLPRVRLVERRGRLVNAGLRPFLAGLISLILAMGLDCGKVCAREPASLTLAEPYRQGNQVYLDFTLRGMFDPEILAALESGLPATLVFSWQIWQVRDGWWDRQILQDQTHFRVYYDMLEDSYDVFAGTGRLLGTCEGIAGVEGILCRQEGLRLAPASDLQTGHWYYVEMNIRLQPLDVEEIKGLEGWLSGEGPGRDESFLAGISRHAVGFLKGIAGLAERNVTARTDPFAGFP